MPTACWGVIPVWWDPSGKVWTGPGSGHMGTPYEQRDMVERITGIYFPHSVASGN